jgi:methylmalonyl-CoA mutase, C-terminal domain
MMKEKKNIIRVLIAKPGLDGHDRGAKAVAMALNKAGMEVIYLGLRKTIDEIVEAAIQEAVDVVGLSILSGAHISLSKKLIEKLEEKKVKKDYLVIVGGIIPTEEDAQVLQKIGVGGVFPIGTSFETIIDFIEKNSPVRS